MEDLLASFEDLKVSAFSKLAKISGDVGNVTIGPNRDSSSRFEKAPVKAPHVNQKPINGKENGTTSGNLYPVYHTLKEIETERRGRVQEAVKHHYDKFQWFTQRQKEEERVCWLTKQKAFVQDMQEQEKTILNAIDENDASIHGQNEGLRKHYHDLIQRKLHYQQQLQMKRDKQKLLNQTMDKIKQSQINFRTIYQEIILLIKSCPSSEKLKNSLGDNFRLLKVLPEEIENIINKCKSGTITEEDAIKSQNIVRHIMALRKQIEEAVVQISRIEKSAEAASQKALEVNLPQDHKVLPNLPERKTDKSINIASLRKYIEMKTFLADYTNQNQDLLNDEQMKQFRFDCKKAINTPVNAISSTSPQHLKDKYLKLFNLLSGKTVFVADKQINAAIHPKGVSFCMDLLAKKFVLQGDLMVSSKPDAAFCYATIIVSLWNDFPDFGKLLLAYFFVQCPHLIPLYIGKTGNQSEEEYYTALGYHYNNGQIEKQDKFLKRMTGLFRLYFSILITKPMKSQEKHPYDIKNAWVFLVSILKLHPQIDITATAVHILLETVGFQMDSTYGKQFKKLLHVITEKLLPLLRTLDCGGPVTRLEVLLQNYKQTGYFEKLPGMLPENFW